MSIPDNKGEFRMIMTRFFGAVTVALFAIGFAAMHAPSGPVKADGYEMTVAASEAAARTVRGQYHRAL
jgi:hypothetical protein